MRISLVRQRFFLISLLVHLLLFLGFTISLKSRLDLQKDLLYQPYYAHLPQKEFSVLPAYISPPNTTTTKATTKTTPVPPKKIETSKNGIKKPVQMKETSESADSAPLKFEAGTGNVATTAKKTVDDELLRLLHDATGRKLVYPDIGRVF